MDLLSDVLAKKELQTMDPEYALREIARYIGKHPKVGTKLAQLPYSQFRRSSLHKDLMSAVRSELRKVYGVFQQNSHKRISLLHGVSLQDMKAHRDLLSTHLSSLERLPYYFDFYEKVFSITGKPSSILDIACGLNPLSIPFMGCIPNYTAIELNALDCAFLQKYFDQVHVPGRAVSMNLLTEYQKLSQYPVDVCFLLKTLDSLEIVEHNITMKILKNIQATYIVVSFPTRSVSGKTLKVKQRKWFEKMILNFKVFEIPNEIVYVISQ